MFCCRTSVALTVRHGNRHFFPGRSRLPFFDLLSSNDFLSLEDLLVIDLGHVLDDEHMSK